MSFLYYYIKNNCISSLSITPGLFNLRGFGVQKSFKCPYNLVDRQMIYVIFDKKSKRITHVILNDYELESHIEKYKINYNNLFVYRTDICSEFWYR